MADPYLQLKLGALTVRFEGYIFEDGEFPRQPEPEQSGTATHSNEGGLSIDGSSFRPKHLWTFSCTTDVILRFQPDLADQVRELESLYDNLRRAGSDPQIELEDTTQYFFEVGSRTRALATGASEVVTTTGVKYYPKYYAVFERPVVYQRGEGFAIQLREGDIFSA